jgi:hypothetical protein
VNIAQCQRQLDRFDEAQSSFQQFLASDSSDDRTRAEVREALDEISAERARRTEVAEAAARQRQQLEARRAPAAVAEPAPDLQVRRAAAPPAAPVIAVAAEPAADKPKKSKKWVWALVGVLAAGAAASAVTVGVLESQPAAPRPGSLGLLDGRR